MRRLLVRSFILCILIVAAGAAESTSLGAVQPGQQLLQSITSLPDGHVNLDVANVSNTAITALIAVGTRSLKNSRAVLQSVRVFDSVTDSLNERPLAGGARYRFVFFGPRPPAQKLRLRSVELKAALFANGSAWGDPTWIEKLTLRRKAAYSYENNALDILMDAKLHPEKVASLVERLKTAESESSVTARTVENRQIAHAVFGEATLLVQHAIQVRLDIASPGTRPPTQQTGKSVADNAIDRMTERIRALTASLPSIRS